MTAPERIWLQDAGDYDHAAQFEVTWCAEPQDDDDTEYIRADLVRALVEALRNIDALDPEGMIGGCSPDAIRGLVLRMGDMARAALRAIGEGGE